MNRPRVLVVDSFPHNCDRLCRGFELEGLEAVAADARVFDQPALAQEFDLVIIDVRSCRARAAALPVPFARRSEAPAPLTLALVPEDERDTALALLEAGLDACLRQPVGLRELVATSRALLRRRQAPAPGLEIHVARRLARLGGEALMLTEQEFQLLHLLARHPGQVFKRETLLSTLWGGQTFVALRTVDALIKRLRQRLDVPGAGHAYIQTVRGVGYRLAESPALPRIVSFFFLPLVTLLSQT